MPTLHFLRSVPRTTSWSGVFLAAQHQHRCDIGNDLAKQRPALIVMEATGKYHLLAFQTLSQAGYIVSVVNGKTSHAFASAAGYIAKTDKVDATALAQMGKHGFAKPTKCPSDDDFRLDELVRTRRQLVASRTMTSNQLEGITNLKAVRALKNVLACIDREIAKIEREIASMLESNPEWKKKAELLETIPGIGKVSSSVILTEFRELGSLNRREVAALAGVAPLNRDSGSKQGKRFIRGGRKLLRSALYMPMLQMIRCNQVIRKFYEHLLELGKVRKVAVIACMRKLLSIANTMLKTGQPFRPNC